MKRFLLLISIAAAVVWLFPVVGPFAGPARASVITTGDVDPGGAGSQPDPWAVGGELKVGEPGSGTLSVTDRGGFLIRTVTSAAILAQRARWQSRVSVRSGTTQTTCMWATGATAH